LQSNFLFLHTYFTLLFFCECLCHHIFEPLECIIISFMKEYQSLVSELCPRARFYTMWVIICHSPYWHLSEEVRHFCRLAADNRVFVRKRFSNDHELIRSPVVGPSGRIPVPCWPRLPNPKLLATSFLYQKGSSPTTVVLWKG